MQTINSLDLIENEFKILQNEMKKRYTNIKEVFHHSSHNLFIYSSS